MASIAGTTIRWPLSPRLVEVPNTETSFSARDAQDTLLDLEDNVEGVVWPKTRSMTGGQDLGDGITVGFTIQYQNAKIVPQRTDSKSSGTVTTGSATQLIDSAADFVTDGVDSGDWIINFTDQSVTEVLEIIDLNTLSVRDLSDGTDNQFDIGDVYKVWHVAEFTLTGGNHVAVDEADSSINPMFPTFGRFCTRTSSSSATALSQGLLEQALFFEGVIYDEANGFAGTGDISGVPIGTRAAPSNNITDALAISVTRNVRTFVILGNADITSGDFSAGYTWIGDSVFSNVRFYAACNLLANRYKEMGLLGTFDISSEFEDCRIYTIGGIDTIISGKVSRCGFTGDYALTGATQLGGATTLHECYSLEPGENYPTFDVGVSPFITRSWIGSIGIRNMTGGTHTIHIEGGRPIFENDCTGGTASVRGWLSTAMEDNSVGTTINYQAAVTEHAETLHEERGVSLDIPVTHTPTSITVNGKTIEHVGDPATSITSTRTA